MRTVYRPAGSTPMGWWRICASASGPTLLSIQYSMNGGSMSLPSLLPRADQVSHCSTPLPSLPLMVQKAASSQAAPPTWAV